MSSHTIRSPQGAIVRLSALRSRDSSRASATSSRITRRRGFAFGSFVRSRRVTEHLSEARGPADGAGEDQRLAGPAQAFAAREGRRARHFAAQPQVVQDRVHLLQVEPPDGQPFAGADVGYVRPVVRAHGGPARHRESLQAAALGQLAGHRRQEAVEQAVMAVFSEVHGPARGMHGGGLVFESAERAQRRSLHEAARVRAHFEDVSMLFVAHDAQAAGVRSAGIREGFLAGQPAAPGCPSTGTVEFGAGEAQELSLGAARVRIVDRGRRAARPRGFAGAPVVHAFPHGVGERRETGAERAVFRVGRLHLVIAYEDHASVATCEGGHPVVCRRHRETVSPSHRRHATRRRPGSRRERRAVAADPDAMGRTMIARFPRAGWSVRQRLR